MITLAVFFAAFLVLVAIDKVVMWYPKYRARKDDERLIKESLQFLGQWTEYDRNRQTDGRFSGRDEHPFITRAKELKTQAARQER
jgi:hypothetical protein